MSRIERSTQPAGNSKRRVVRGIRSFFGFLIRIPFKISLRLLILLFLLFAAVYVLRTGFWTVPVVSAIVYREPSPLHEVQKKPFSENLMLLKTEETLRTAGTEGAVITLTEGELMSLVQRFTWLEEPVLLDVTTSITETYVEVYGRVAHRPQVIVRLAVVPVIDDSGMLRMDVHRAWVGQSPVPVFLLSSRILTWLTPPLFDTLIETVSIERIDLKEGFLEFHITSV